MSLTARLIAFLLLVLAGLAGAWRVHVKADAAGYARAQAGASAAAEALRQRNFELQRAAEKRYTVAAETRDRFITNTITEVRYATVHLAACPVGADAVRLLNAAAACARGDSAACGPGQPVPDAR